MNVRLGWSGDIHGTWTKMDVEVDQSDIQSLFAEKGIHPDTQLDPLAKFKLMYTMAEMFVLLHKMSRFPDIFGGPEGKKELKDLVDAQAKIVEAVKA